jgi:CRISPR-associated protein Csx14
MSEREPNIKIPVDLTNPGQFFACCGLLELADRLWPGAEVAGWFQLHRFDRATFRIGSTAQFDARSIVASLLGCNRTAVDPVQLIRGSDGKPTNDAEKTRPVLIGLPVNLRLNWWLAEIAGRLNEFKTWGSHQTSLSLFDDIANEINLGTVTDETLFRSPVGMTGRFGFDPRSSWNAGDTGFSPNDHSLPVETYPVVELLAAIALQAFSPRTANDKYFFTPWEQALPAIVARAAVSGAMGLSDSRLYGFAILSRGKFKFFSKAEQSTRSNHV